MQNQVFCRFCGNTMPADSQFCPHCGKSQGGPVAAAAPPMPAPAPTMGTGAQKASKLPIILAAIAGIFVLCCVGVVLSQVLMRDTLGGTLPEIVATSATSAAQQTDLSKKWTPAFMVLYGAEQHYVETITKFERVAAGTLTRETYQNQFAVPDAYDMLFLAYFRAEEVDTEAMSEETAIKYAATRPLVLTLEDDFETVMNTELLWFADELDKSEAMSRLRQGQQALLAERDKMYQAAKMDGMTDKTYALIQTSIEEQWPALKAKFDALGIKMLTPQP